MTEMQDDSPEFFLLNCFFLSIATGAQGIFSMNWNKWKGRDHQYGHNFLFSLVWHVDTVSGKG